MKNTVENMDQDSNEIKEKILERRKILRELAMGKQLNFLIGSGASYPAIPLMSEIKGENTKEKNQKLLEEIKDVSKSLICPNENKERNNSDVLNSYENFRLAVSDVLNNANSRQMPREATLFTINYDLFIEKTLNSVLENISLVFKEKVLKSYENFILAVSDVLNNANSRQVPREATLFTTNYDLFIEKALDSVLENTSLVFNDGARGYFNRYLDGSNYNKSVSYRGLNNNYIDELPSLSLIKPHGSVNWERADGDKIVIKNKVVENPVVVPPTGYEDEATFLNNHFHDMLRIFQLELDKPQSVLFVVGFSFQDKHIGKMVKRALKNRELVIVCFCFDEKIRQS